MIHHISVLCTSYGLRSTPYGRMRCRAARTLGLGPDTLEIVPHGPGNQSLFFCFPEKLPSTEYSARNTEYPLGTSTKRQLDHTKLTLRPERNGAKESTPPMEIRSASRESGWWAEGFVTLTFGRVVGGV